MTNQRPTRTIIKVAIAAALLIGLVSAPFLMKDSPVFNFGWVQSRADWMQAQASKVGQLLTQHRAR